jgi:hypothetical protein
MRPLLFLFVLASCIAALAQPGGGGDPGAGEPVVPIQGIGVLLVGGALLGLLRMFNKKDGDSKAG